MKNKMLSTEGVQSAMLAKAGIALAVTMIAMKIHAEVVIGFASVQGGVNEQSDGTPLDGSFTFELGTFDNGFTPNAGNTDLWLDNWVPVQDSDGAPLAGSTAVYGEQSGLFGSTYDGYKSTVTLDHNNNPFGEGAQGYVWGFDTRTGDSEWILMTNDGTHAGTDWDFPSGTDASPTESWTVGTSGAILGAVNFNDPEKGAISLQTANVGAPPVPEPSSGLILISALAMFAARRRR